MAACASSIANIILQAEIKPFQAAKEAETMEMMKEDGRQEGEQKTWLLDIRNLMDSTGWTAEKAMDLLKIPQDQRTILYVNLSRKA